MKSDDKFIKSLAKLKETLDNIDGAKSYICQMQFDSDINITIEKKQSKEYNSTKVIGFTI